MTRQRIANRSVMRKLTRMVATMVTGPDGRGRETREWVPDGAERVTVEVFLDWDAVDALARKAAGNTSKRSKDGALEVRVVSRIRTEPSTRPQTEEATP